MITDVALQACDDTCDGHMMRCMCNDHIQEPRSAVMRHEGLLVYQCEGVLCTGVKVYWCEGVPV